MILQSLSNWVKYSESNFCCLKYFGHFGSDQVFDRMECYIPAQLVIKLFV